jgi:hypothetical protein
VGGHNIYDASGHTAVALQRTPSGAQVAIKSHPLAALDAIPALDALVRPPSPRMAGSGTGTGGLLGRVGRLSGAGRTLGVV